ncbi:MAG TPA: DPP IV N-terminal domain-containing protein [Polyangiales bacterium]|nr:DPP IV N-terminal domain-containing protein [Polyangiales bacterium]
MSQAPSPWPALNEAFLEASAATLGFRLGHPQPLAITADQGVLFRRTGARDRRADLYLLEPGGETRRVTSAEELLAGAEETLSAAERARRERTRTVTAGIVDIDLSETGTRVLVPLGERVFVHDRASGKSHEVELGSGTPFDMHISPDGKHVSFVRDGDLWLADAAGKAAPRRLTQHPPGIEYGLSEFVAQEEFDRQRGYFWSPDSRFIAFERSDARGVTTVYVSDPAHPERAPDEFKYPRPGADNAIVDLGIVAVSGGQPRWVRWDLARYPYLVNVEWPKSGPLCLTVMNRAQTELLLLAVDPTSGDTRELLQGTDPAWISRPAGAPAWLEDGSGFLWLREGEPGDAIELHDPQGALVRTILPASFGTRAIVGIEANAAIVLASVDPREQHVYRVPFSGEAPQPLTSGGGVHVALADHGVVVITSALREGGSSISVIGKDGRRHELPSVGERPSLTPTTQLESVELEGRTHYVAITRPRDFQAGKRYPVLLKVYGGPGAQMVLDYRDSYVLDQWYADAGFIVVRTDNRGSPNHGHAWEKAILQDLISVPLEDQVAALGKLFERHTELDRKRVGIFGWSFGGYLSTLALLLRPDVFHAAVAGAPVTAWELYDTAYTERYMKLPADNPEGYRHTSALTHAAKLERPLLLIHGVTDDNVHFAHTLALIEALYRAGKRAEVVALSSTHMLADPKLNFAREKIQADFFREKLGHE